METRPYKRAKQEESDIEDDDEGEDDDELVDDEEEPEYDDKGQLIERKRGKVKGKGGSSCHQWLVPGTSNKPFFVCTCTLFIHSSLLCLLCYICMQ